MDVLDTKEFNTLLTKANASEAETLDLLRGILKTRSVKEPADVKEISTLLNRNIKTLNDEINPKLLRDMDLESRRQGKTTSDVNEKMLKEGKKVDVLSDKEVKQLKTDKQAIPILVYDAPITKSLLPEKFFEALNQPTKRGSRLGYNVLRTALSKKTRLMFFGSVKDPHDFSYKNSWTSMKDLKDAAVNYNKKLGEAKKEIDKVLKKAVAKKVNIMSISIGIGLPSKNPPNLSLIHI